MIGASIACSCGPRFDENQGDKSQKREHDEKVCPQFEGFGLQHLSDWFAARTHACRLRDDTALQQILHQIIAGLEFHRLLVDDGKQADLGSPFQEKRGIMK